MKRWRAFLPVLAATMALTAGDPAPFPVEPDKSDLVWQVVEVPGYEAVRLHVPRDWQVFATGTPPGEPVDVRLWPLEGKESDSEIHLYIRAPRAGSKAPALADIRLTVGGMRAAMLSSPGREGGDSLKELRSRSVTGYYFSIIDRSAAPRDGWRSMTFGSRLLGDFELRFSLQSHTDPSRYLVPTLDMMRDVELKLQTPEEAAATAASAEGDAGRWEPIDRSQAAGNLDLTIGLPDKVWEVWVDLPDYNVQQKKVEPDKSSAILTALHPGTGIGFSAYVKRVRDKKVRSSGQCMDLLAAQAKLPTAMQWRERHVERDGMEIVQYDVGGFEGVVINQRNADAYLYRDGACIDIHIYKNNFRPADAPLFDLVLNNLKFVTKQPLP
jgi:hypothetical protein